MQAANAPKKAHVMKAESKNRDTRKARNATTATPSINSASGTRRLSGPDSSGANGYFFSGSNRYQGMAGIFHSFVSFVSSWSDHLSPMFGGSVSFVSASTSPLLKAAR